MTLKQRLQAFFAQPGVRHWAPASLLATATGIILATVVKDVSVAQSGLGLVLSGIAINLTSGLLQPLLDAVDDETRGDLVQQQLADPTTQAEAARLSAAALVKAGPELAEALPPASRERLITMLEQSMAASDGVLMQIATPYAAALRAPHADWSALRELLRTSIETTALRAEVGDHGRIEDPLIEQHGQPGHVQMDLKGGTGATIVRPTIIRTGGAPPTVSSRRCPDCGANVPPGRSICPSCGLALTSAALPNSVRQEPAPLTLPIPDPPVGIVRLQLTLHSDTTGIAVRWETSSGSIQHSHMRLPYAAEDLPLVVRTLDVLQYPHYPNSMTPGEERLFCFNVAEQQRLSNYQLWNGQRVAHDTPQRVGRALYQALLADPAAAQAMATVQAIVRERATTLALQLHFSRDDVLTAALPWELLWDAGPLPLLMQHGRTTACTRHLDLPDLIAPNTPRSGPLRILAIAPAAGIDSQLRSAEQAMLTQAWQRWQTEQLATIRVITTVTRRALIDELHQHPPDIVHYYGHGAYRHGSARLLFDGQDGGSDEVDVTAFASALGQVRLVTLFACQGAQIDPGGSLFSSLAPALSAIGVPMVLGMQVSLRTEIAIRAAEVLYRHLAANQSIQDAVAKMRQALLVEEHDRTSWFVPALYLRSRENQPMLI